MEEKRNEGKNLVEMINESLKKVRKVKLGPMGLELAKLASKG